MNIPTIEEYRGVGIHGDQPRDRIEAIVKPEIDRVLAMKDLGALFDFAGDVSKSPEARLLAAAKCKATFQIAVDERRKRPAVTLELIDATVAGLDSMEWRDSAAFCSLLCRPPQLGNPGPAPSTLAEERMQMVRQKARQLLNGHGHVLVEDRKPPSAADEEDLMLERQAIDLILEKLGQRYTQQFAFETLVRARERDAEIRAILRDFFLAICRLRAIRDTVDAMTHDLAGAPLPFGNFFADWDGWDGALLRINEGQFESAIREAVKAGVASQSEIRRAMKP